MRLPRRKVRPISARIATTPIARKGETLELPDVELVVDEVVVVDVVVLDAVVVGIEVVEDVVDVVDEVVEVVEVVVTTETVKGEDAVSADTEAISLPDTNTVFAPLEGGTVNVQENLPVEDMVRKVQV